VWQVVAVHASIPDGKIQIEQQKKVLDFYRCMKSGWFPEQVFRCLR
jgi:hypothetical protein